MKTLLILSLLFGIFSCSNTPKNITAKSQLITPYFIDKDANTFNLNDESIYQKIGDIVPLEKNKVDTSLHNFVTSQLERYYDVYYYSTLPIQKENVILYAYHDYYRDFILVTFIDDKPFDARIIATVLGDGGDFYCKYSTLKQDYIESTFEEGYKSFTEPIDTIYYKLAGISKIYINDNGQIIEDTLKTTRDSVTVYNINNSKIKNR